VGEPYSASVGTKVCAPASVFSQMSGFTRVATPAQANWNGSPSLMIGAISWVLQSR
jgi:hypothetical protein